MSTGNLHEPVTAHDARPRRTRLVLQLLGASLLAALILVAVVLPAEYSIDPLGSGRALGLLGLGGDADAADARALTVHPEVYRVDQRQFELAPFESVEHSYQMSLGASLVFSWQASDELVFNLHSSPALPPAGAPADYAESFASGRAVRRQGAYTATFTGRHGWFWENRTAQTVQLRLAVAGFVSEAQSASLAGQERVVLRGALSAEH